MLARVTSVLLLQSPAGDRPDLAADFAAAGFDVRGPGDCAHLVREALRAAADVVVCWVPRPEMVLLEAVATLQAQQSTPLLCFTQDSGVELMQRALDAGVHAWVVQGYAPERLRPLVHLTLAREARERGLRTQVAELAARLEERKLVDKAKGILMRAQQVTEEEAFRLLRTASMQGNQRVGEVSRHVIDSALVAQAINRAGQQRMLSQRLVILYAMVCTRTDAAAASLLIRQSAERIEGNLAALESSVSAATFGDLIASARQGWAALATILKEPPQAQRLPEVDRLAEAVLNQADALVSALESSGLAASVRVINASGRVRMLSQRMAKLALLQHQGIDSAAVMAATAPAFEQGLAVLTAAPLSTPAIRDLLQSAQQAWDTLLAAIPQAGQKSGRLQVAAASEELLSLCDRLTEAYQHSIQVLMG